MNGLQQIEFLSEECKLLQVEARSRVVPLRQSPEEAQSKTGFSYLTRGARELVAENFLYLRRFAIK